MKLSDILTEDQVRIPLLSRTKEEIIEELLDLLVKSGKVDDPPLALRDVLAREALMSTGIGKGIAVPHGKSTGVKELALSVGIVPDGIDFDSLDGEPSRIFFFLLSPPDVSGPHVKILARISGLLRHESVRDDFLGAPAPGEVLRVIKREEGRAEG